MEQFYVQLAKECEVINRNFDNVGADIGMLIKANNALGKAMKKQHKFDTKVTVALFVGGCCVYGLNEMYKKMSKKIDGLEQEVHALKYPDLIAKED